MKLKDDDKRVLNEKNFPEKIKKMIEDMPKDDIMKIHDFAEYVLIKERVSKTDMKPNEKLTDKEISKIAEEGSFDGKMAERIDYAKETDYLIANYKWKRDNGLNDKKYGLTNETMEIEGHTLHRIRALKDFGNVKEGDFGGYIESEKNLSQEGNCWVGNDAKVYGIAKVYDDAKVYENAEVYDGAWVSGSAMVCENAQVYGEASVFGDAMVRGSAKVHDDADVYNHAMVYEDAEVYGDARVYDDACIYGEALVSGSADVYGKAKVYGSARVYGDAKIKEEAVVEGNAEISEGKVSEGRINGSKKKNIELD